MKRLTVLMLLLILLFPVMIHAQTGEKWEENYRRWQKLPPERKEELRLRFQQLKSMSPEQRQAFFARLAWFQNLPQERKEEMREKFQFFRGLPPEQQQSIRKFVGRWQQAPVLEREMMKRRIQRLRGMPPEQREQTLRDSRIWMRLNDQQRQGLRQFLFSEHSPFDRMPPPPRGEGPRPRP